MDDVSPTRKERGDEGYIRTDRGLVIHCCGK